MCLGTLYALPVFLMLTVGQHSSLSQRLCPIHRDRSYVKMQHKRLNGPSFMDPERDLGIMIYIAWSTGKGKRLMTMTLLKRRSSLLGGFF